MDIFDHDAYFRQDKSASLEMHFKLQNMRPRLKRIFRTVAYSVTPNEFLDLTRKIQKLDYPFDARFFDTIVSKYASNSKIQQEIKELLLETHAVTRLYQNAKEDYDELEEYYLSNLSTDETVNKRMVEMLKLRLVRLLPGYKNITTGGINVFNLKRDFNAWVNKGRLFEISREQILKSVIISSLYDALICRKKYSEKVLLSYFNDERKGRYFLLTDEYSRTTDSISKEIGDLYQLMKRNQEGTDQKCAGKDSDWARTFDFLSRNPSTSMIRKSIMNEIDNLFKSDDVISHDDFNQKLNELYAFFTDSFEPENLKQDEYKTKIISVIQYLYANDADIRTFIFSCIQSENKNEPLVDLFIYWIHEVSLRLNQQFLSVFMNRYRHFFYLYVKSYILKGEIAKKQGIDFFLILLKNILTLQKAY